MSQSGLEILLLLDVPLERRKLYFSILKKKGNPDRKNICHVLGLAGGNTKKRGNKKSGESTVTTPIRYNVIQSFTCTFSRDVLFH